MAGICDWRLRRAMPSDRFTIEGLGRADADRQVAAYMAMVPPPKSVSTTREEDGTYTVIVTFDVRIVHHNDNRRSADR